MNYNTVASVVIAASYSDPQERLSPLLTLSYPLSLLVPIIIPKLPILITNLGIINPTLGLSVAQIIFAGRLYNECFKIRLVCQCDIQPVTLLLSELTLLDSGI
jgi:hypothetical protein